MSSQQQQQQQQQNQQQQQKQERKALSTSTSSFEALDPHDPHLNHLASLAFSKSADWISGELESVDEEYKLLIRMNKVTATKYSDLTIG